MKKTFAEFNRSTSNWCDSHKRGILTALVIEMLIVGMMTFFQIGHHFYKYVPLNSGIEIVSAVLLFLALRQPARSTFTVRQKVWVTMAILTGSAVAYCIGVIVTIHFFTHRDILNIIFNP